METLIKAFFLLSPIIVWSILVWYSFKWEKHYKGRSPEELAAMNYYKKKKRNDLLLWLSGFIATIIFMLLLARFIW
jgi:hypothetical protein